MCRAMRRTDAERQRTGAGRRRWFRGGQGRGRAVRSARRCPPWVSRTHVTLRPVNVRGHRAKGMRAPENTNQFLMTEKYRLHALRSDSVDSASDSDPELTDSSPNPYLGDMDTYLGDWEHAHGALLDTEPEDRDRKHRVRTHPDGRGDLGDRDLGDRDLGDRDLGDRDLGDRLQTAQTVPSVPSVTSVTSVTSVCALLIAPSEDSAQYFPSEDDLVLSDNFMHRDFTEFCHFVTS